MGPVTDEIARAIDQLMARLSGPLSFRFVLQPLMAAALAVRAGVRDARERRRPYLWSVLVDRRERLTLIRNGWRDVTVVFAVAVVLDAAYQITVLRVFYVLQTLIVASALALLPYVAVRGTVTRVIGARNRLRGLR